VKRILLPAALLTLMAVGNSGRTEERPPPGSNGTPPTPTYNPNATAEGLTLGYWKNHTQSWPTYYLAYTDNTNTTVAPVKITTDTTLGSVFPTVDPTYANVTLLDALNFKGGTGVLGGERILLKQAVASLLNAASNGGTQSPLAINFPIEEWDLVLMVSLALATDDRDTMIELSTQLDTDNNLELAH
jgi:hypothetical protein